MYVDASFNSAVAHFFRFRRLFVGIVGTRLGVFGRCRQCGVYGCIVIIFYFRTVWLMLGECSLI